MDETISDFLSKRNVHGVWCGRRCVYITIVFIQRERANTHSRKKYWTVVDGFRFMCIHIAFWCGEGGKRLSLRYVRCVYSVYIWIARFDSSACGKKLLARTGSDVVMWLTRTAVAKLNSIRLEAGGKGARAKGAKRKREKKEEWPPPCISSTCMCVYTPTVLYLLLLQITGQQRESATSVWHVR